MKYLISYDIEDNKKRRKVSNLLIEYSFIRIQKSVFIGEVSEKELCGLEKKIISLLKNCRHSLFINRITQNDLIYENEKSDKLDSIIPKYNHFLIL